MSFISALRFFVVITAFALTGCGSKVDQSDPGAVAKAFLQAKVDQKDRQMDALLRPGLSHDEIENIKHGAHQMTSGFPSTPTITVKEVVPTDTPSFQWVAVEVSLIAPNGNTGRKPGHIPVIQKEGKWFVGFRPK